MEFLSMRWQKQKKTGSHNFLLFVVYFSQLRVIARYTVCHSFCPTVRST